MLATRRAPRRRWIDVPQNPTTLLDEMLAAARGVPAIVMGDRKAGRYFDFSRRGLAGSFIALIVATVLNAYMPSFTGGDSSSLPPAQGLAIAAFLFAMQIGFSVLVLRQINRLDALAPYLVADNWATFFINLLFLVLALVGLPTEVAVLVPAILALVIEINTARVIMTLGRWQIAMLIVAQVVGLGLGLLVLGMFLPLPPDAAATLP